MIGILLALCVALLKSMGELAGKIFMDDTKKDALDEYSLAWGVRVVSFIILLPCIFWIGIPLLTMNTFWVLCANSILGTVTTLTMFKALKYGDLSVVSPLSALTTPFLLITSYLITHELPNMYGLIGVIIISFGTYFLHIDTLKNGLLSPFIALFHNLGARYMFLTTILWSISAPLDKIGVAEVGAISWMFLTNALISFFFIFVMLAKKRPLKIGFITQKKHLKKILIISGLGGFGVFLQLLAIKYTLVIYVIALKRGSVMFSVILGALFLKEKNILPKLIAAGIMLAGVAIISIFGNI